MPFVAVVNETVYGRYLLGRMRVMGILPYEYLIQRGIDVAEAEYGGQRANSGGRRSGRRGWRGSHLYSSPSTVSHHPGGNRAKRTSNGPRSYIGGSSVAYTHGEGPHRPSVAIRAPLPPPPPPHVETAPPMPALGSYYQAHPSLLSFPVVSITATGYPAAPTVLPSQAHHQMVDVTHSTAGAYFQPAYAAPLQPYGQTAYSHAYAIQAPVYAQHQQ